MPNIEDIGIPYPPDRSGLVATTGPSRTNAPSELAQFDHYNIWIPAKSFKPRGNSCLPHSTPLEWVSLVYQNGVDINYNAADFAMRRPRTWTDGNITARIWYTGTYVAATNIRLDVGFTLSAYGVYAFIDHSDLAFDVPTPDAAVSPGDDYAYMIDKTMESDTTGNGYVTITPDTDIIVIFVGRDGDHANDTYTAEWLFIGAEIMYRPRIFETTGATTLSPWLMNE